MNCPNFQCRRVRHNFPKQSAVDKGLQIGRALGYDKPDVSIPQLYTRHADEITDKMTAVVKRPTEGDAPSQAPDGIRQ